MARIKKTINREIITSKFSDEIKACLSEFKDLTFSKVTVSYDNLQKDVLPLIQVTRVGAAPTQNLTSRQKWTFLYRVSIITKRDDKDDNPYEIIDPIFDALSNHFNKTGLDIIDLDGQVEGVYVVGQEDDEGIYNKISVGEMYFEIVAT